jgi:flavodoxin
MHVLVAYYSRTGHTKQVAEEIAKELKCDADEILDTVNRAGPIGFLMAGRQASTTTLTKLQPIRKDPANYDLVIVGTPVWARHVSTPVRTYIVENKDKLKKVAFFVTEGDKGDEQTIKEMEELSGKKAAGTLVVKVVDIKTGDYREMVKKFVQGLSA